MESTKPEKQAVRDWLAQRQADKAPPPEPQEVRRQLGWQLLQPVDPRDCQR